MSSTAEHWRRLFKKFNQLNSLQLILKRKINRSWNKKEENVFLEMKKSISEIHYLTLFARDRDSFVTHDASESGPGITLLRKEKSNTVRLLAFAVRYLIEAAKYYSLGEFHFLVIVWWLDNITFWLWGKAHLYWDRRALEILKMRNRSKRRYNAGLTRWLYRLKILRTIFLTSSFRPRDVIFTNFEFLCHTKNAMNSIIKKKIWFLKNPPDCLPKCAKFSMVSWLRSSKYERIS